MSKSQRRKGGQGEREAASILSDALGFVVLRELGQARNGGCDIKIKKKRGHFMVEVKRRERIAVSDWIRQARDACGSDDIPVVMMREDGDEWIVALTLRDFLPLMRDQL